MADKYLSEARVSELWAAVKTALALKTDKSAMEEYPTVEAMATAISTTLADYSTLGATGTAIAAALVAYSTTNETGTAITKALKSYATTAEVAVAVAEAAGLSFSVVAALPVTGDKRTVYLVSNGGSGSNCYDEFLWTNERFEKIGSTETNLSDYWKKADLVALTASELTSILV